MIIGLVCIVAVVFLALVLGLGYIGFLLGICLLIDIAVFVLGTIAWLCASAFNDWTLFYIVATIVGVWLIQMHAAVFAMIGDDIRDWCQKTFRSRRYTVPTVTPNTPTVAGTHSFRQGSAYRDLCEYLEYLRQYGQTVPALPNDDEACKKLYYELFIDGDAAIALEQAREGKPKQGAVPVEIPFSKTTAYGDLVDYLDGINATVPVNDDVAKALHKLLFIDGDAGKALAAMRNPSTARPTATQATQWRRQ